MTENRPGARAFYWWEGDLQNAAEGYGYARYGDQHLLVKIIGGAVHSTHAYANKADAVAAAASAAYSLVVPYLGELDPKAQVRET